jgi:hypothetical protein
VGGPAIALLLLWFSFRGVDAAELVAQLRRANPLLLALNLCSAPAHLWLRAWRWRSLLAPVRASIPLRETFSATAIGYLAGILPGRIGEVLRPALLSRRQRIPFAPTLATAGVERVVLDLLVILFLGGLALLLPAGLTGLDAGEGSGWLPRFQQIGAVALVLAAISLVSTHLIGRHRKRLAAWLHRRAERTKIRGLGPICRWIASLLPGFATMASWRGMGVVIGQTLLIWVVTSAGMHAGIRACGVEIPPAGMLVLLPILVAGISIPTPGNTGTFHLAMKLGVMTFFGADEATALGAGLVVHLANWLPLLVIGGACIGFGGLKTPDDDRPDGAK